MDRIMVVASKSCVLLLINSRLNWYSHVTNTPDTLNIYPIILKTSACHSSGRVNQEFELCALNLVLLQGDGSASFAKCGEVGDRSCSIKLHTLAWREILKRRIQRKYSWDREWVLTCGACSSHEESFLPLNLAEDLSLTVEPPWDSMPWRPWGRC